MKEDLATQIIVSNAHDAGEAVHKIWQENKIKDAAGIILFCSSHYDRAELSRSLNASFDCLVIGCTSAGEITNTFHDESLVALVLSKAYFALHCELVTDVQNFKLPHALTLTTQIENKLEFSNHFNATNMLGLLFTDGLSLKEENVTSLLYQAFGGINIIGGSAGDNLEFKETFVFCKGAFHQNAAAVVLIESQFDFEFFRIQHFIPTDKEVIITEVDFDKHIVKEIDGEPATIAYANINGLDASSLKTVDFAMYPLMLKISDEWYIRSISNVEKNQCLQFRCAIDSGLPLRVGKGIDIVQRFEREVEKIEAQFEEIYFTLGCDCISRRLEISQKGLNASIEQLYKRIKFFGFNSYGEQFNGIHFNQTLVAVVVGKKRHE